jgi:hypothetical protein
MNSPTPRKTILLKNPYLTLNKQGQTKKLELASPQYLLGREDNPQATLPVPQDWIVVSRQQAILHKYGDDYIIYDGDGRLSWL